MCAGTLPVKEREAMSWPLSNPLCRCYRLIQGSLLFWFWFRQGSLVSSAKVLPSSASGQLRGGIETEASEASNECSTIPGTNGAVCSASGDGRLDKQKNGNVEQDDAPEMLRQTRER